MTEINVQTISLQLTDGGHRPGARRLPGAQAKGSEVTMKSAEIKQVLVRAAEGLEEALEPVPATKWYLHTEDSHNHYVVAVPAADDKSGTEYDLVLEEWAPRLGVGKYVLAMQPKVGRALMKLLRTEAANIAGDLDHSACKSENCPTIAAYETALEVISVGEE